MIDICKVQRKLNLLETGIVDDLTMAGIRNFQLKNNISPSGIVDDITIKTMFADENTHIMTDNPNISTDLMESAIPVMDTYELPTSQYITTETKKEYIFGHHTAGWNDPYATIKDWRDDDRGKIATQYVIGGVHPKTGDTKYDGLIVKAFSGNGYAYHLGAVDPYMHSHSIGIELCNFGWLTKKGTNYYTYANTLVDPSQVCDIGTEFRGYRYYHKYSDNQLSAFSKLLKYLSATHGISLGIGLRSRLSAMSAHQAFDYYDEAFRGKVKGFLSHTSVRKDKFDMSPQPNLIKMIANL
jgi:hypothetical protein